MSRDFWWRLWGHGLFSLPVPLQIRHLVTCLMEHFHVPSSPWRLREKRKCKTAAMLVYDTGVLWLKELYTYNASNVLNGLQSSAVTQPNRVWLFYFLFCVNVKTVLLTWHVNSTFTTYLFGNNICVHHNQMLHKYSHNIQQNPSKQTPDSSMLEL